MTLHEVIHGAAFSQAFNFYMQQRSLIPPGSLDDGFNTRIAFAQDLEAAQEYARAQADLAWAYYQKIPPGPVYEWVAPDETTNPYDRSFTAPRPPARPASSVPPPPPLARTSAARDPQRLKNTVRVPTAAAVDREWRSADAEEASPPPPYHHHGTFPY